MKNSRATLSIAMIVKNEAAIMAQCLDSISPVADEIVVVDTGSTDETAEIAREYHAKVILSDWRDDFSYSRNLSLQACSSTWILWIDADDRVPTNSLPLLAHLKREQPDKVFAMIIKNQRLDGTGTEFLQARMFPNNPAIRFNGAIHEQMMPSASRLGMNMVSTEVVIEHHGYASHEELKKKAQRNVRLLLKHTKTTSNDPVTCIEIGDSFQIMEDFNQATEWYKKVIHNKQEDKTTKTLASQAHMGLGNILNRADNFQEALDHFDQAHLLCPERSDVLYCKAVSLEMLKQKEEAVQCLSEIFSMKPVALPVGVDFRQTEIKAYLRAIRLLRELGEKEKLLNLCEQALRKLSDRQEIQNMAGVSFLQCNKLLEALHCFEKSLSIIFDNNIDAYTGLCMIYRMVGKLDVAKDTIKNIKTLFSAYAQFWALYHLIDPTEAAKAMPASISKQELEFEMQAIESQFQPILDSNPQ